MKSDTKIRTLELVSYHVSQRCSSSNPFSTSLQNLLSTLTYPLHTCLSHTFESRFSTHTFDVLSSSHTKISISQISQISGTVYDFVLYTVPKIFPVKKNWIVYYPNRETFWVSQFNALRNARISRDPSSLWYQHTHPIQVIPQWKKQRQRDGSRGKCWRLP